MLYINFEQAFYWFITTVAFTPWILEHINTGVNKKPKKFKTVWHGFRGILKLSGRVNQANLKLSAGFPNTVCWTSSTFFCVANCLIDWKWKETDFIFVHGSTLYQKGLSANSITVSHPSFSLSNEKMFKTVYPGSIPVSLRTFRHVPWPPGPCRPIPWPPGNL